MNRRAYSSVRGLAALSAGGGVPVRQTKLAPDGAEFISDTSAAGWVEDSLSDFGTLRSLLPDGFAAYARVFHPAYLDPACADGGEQRAVRWSTVASWTGKTAHPLMQFNLIAGLGSDFRSAYEDPPWGSHPRHGTIPTAECRALVENAQRLHRDSGYLLLLPLGRVREH